MEQSGGEWLLRVPEGLAQSAPRLQRTGGGTARWHELHAPVDSCVLYCCTLCRGRGRGRRGGGGGGGGK